MRHGGGRGADLNQQRLRRVLGHIDDDPITHLQVPEMSELAAAFVRGLVAQGECLHDLRRRQAMRQGEVVSLAEAVDVDICVSGSDKIDELGSFGKNPESP